MAEIPNVPKEDLPPCHAGGANPEGYDVSDQTCGNCPDKFTCLPLSIDTSLIESVLSDDTEVDQVLNERMSYAEAITRMQMRQGKIADGKPIPKSLSLHPEEVEDEEEPEEEEPEDETPEKGLDKSTPEPESEPKKKVTKKKVPKKKVAVPKKKTAKKKVAVPKKKVAKKKVAAPKKKATPKKKALDLSLSQVATAPKATPKKKAAKKKTATVPVSPPKVTKPPKKKVVKKKVVKKKVVKKKKTATKGKPTEDKPKRRSKGTDVKDLPKPRAVTEEQMLRSMAKIKLGMAIDLDYGMSLVRKNRDGTESIVTITRQGYEHDGLVYGSLSAAAMVASDSPFRSGNDFFNLVNSGCTEVRDDHGKVIARKGMLIR